MNYNDILDLINLNLASNGKIPASKHRAVEIALLNYIQLILPQSGDIKMVKCDLTYLNDNFETSGIGKNLREGWRIYSEITGRVPLGYGLGYSELQGVGGYKDAIVVEHSHGIKYQSRNVSKDGSERVLTNDGTGNLQNTELSGISGENRNMMPYLITLYIIKI